MTSNATVLWSSSSSGFVVDFDDDYYYCYSCECECHDDDYYDYYYDLNERAKVSEKEIDALMWIERMEAEMNVTNRRLSLILMNK